MLKKVKKVLLDIQNIEEITLLSIEEVELAKQNVPDVFKENASWWLRSPGYLNSHAAYVSNGGIVYADGRVVDRKNGLRPALRIDDLKANNLRIGDKIQVANRDWTVISNDLALCDEIIQREPFNYDKTHGNNYESSHIKEVLDKWEKEMRLTTENGYAPESTSKL